MQNPVLHGTIGYVTALKHAEVVEWYTRTTQNRVGFARVGSSPTFGTIHGFQKWHLRWGVVFIVPEPMGSLIFCSEGFSSLDLEISKPAQG